MARLRERERTLRPKEKAETPGPLAGSQHNERMPGRARRREHGKTDGKGGRGEMFKLRKTENEECQNLTRKKRKSGSMVKNKNGIADKTQGGKEKN